MKVIVKTVKEQIVDLPDEYFEKSNFEDFYDMSNYSLTEKGYDIVKARFNTKNETITAITELDEHRIIDEF